MVFQTRHVEKKYCKEYKRKIKVNKTHKTVVTRNPKKKRCVAVFESVTCNIIMRDLEILYGIEK